MVKLFYISLIEVKTFLRYPLEIITWLFTVFAMCLPAISICIFRGINSSMFSYATFYEYLLFLLISTTYWGFIENFWDSIFELRVKMREGTLENTFLMPIGPLHLLCGWASKGMITTIFQTLPLIIPTIAYSTIKLDSSEYIILILVFFLSIFANYGLSLVLVGISLYFKEADQIISIIANIVPFTSGLYFPIGFLPKIFLPLCILFPFSWSLDLIRNIIFKSDLLLSFELEFSILLLLTILYILLGKYVYVLYEKKSKMKGLNGF